MAESPIEGQIVMLAAAKASVGPRRVAELARRVQADLGPRLPEYRRQYELVHETGDACYFFVDSGHWDHVGERLGFDRHEADAVRRAHHEQVLRLGRREGRREEFETALEIRDCVVLGGD